MLYRKNPVDFVMGNVVAYLPEELHDKFRKMVKQNNSNTSRMIQILVENQDPKETSPGLDGNSLNAGPSESENRSSEVDTGAQKKSLQPSPTVQNTPGQSRSPSPSAENQSRGWSLSLKRKGGN